MTNKPINMQEQILDSWFLARFWILKDQKSYSANRFISWYKANLASPRGYDSIAEQMGLKIEAMNVSNVQYTSRTGDTIYRRHFGVDELYFRNTENENRQLPKGLYQISSDCRNERLAVRL